MAKQAIKKGAGTTANKRKSLSDWKQNKGLGSDESKKDKGLEMSNADKPLKWFLMPEAYTDAVKIPGIPMNTVVGVFGHSNVGKSTLVNHAIVSAQKQGIIPVIIDTENAFSFQYAKSMGFECEPVYGMVEEEIVNTETGEINIEEREEIVSWEGDFIYYNTNLLAKRFGNYDYSKGITVSKFRKEAVIEDVAACINELLDAQDDGEIEQGFLFVWDSVGSMISFKDYASKSANAMWSANAMSVAFNNIVNNRIPSSKKISHKYDNTFLYIQKVWMDSMTNPVGPAIMQPKGGKSLYYATRLQILLGGQLTSSVKYLKATSKGLNYNYGIETKIKVLKNHLDAPYNVCYEGKMVVTDTGFVLPDKLEDFKKSHISEILKELNKMNKDGGEITSEDVDFVEEDGEE